ncbi:uncharacterized protein LOC111921528 [Lactuca sativa]|uniref:Uncharacterized protein n=1 Tax=Lactuca sativa TaxID=4236 RepID=A0A9R1V3G0_LACSA|nr:uncharacterized protein LOC111921528 [Lactuca sativa]KAJ0198149.1 hypothetical protein LSAT_V11C700383120 [Lactuca sativa]
MGKSGSSSKKKYSKKKSLKVSSEARRKKRSRRNKSKKLSRHDDSYTSYSDDDSTSSSLISSSSSEGEYKSRKSRSRTRNEVKGSKKRSRRRSSSEDSSNDSLPVKKRRRSKKKPDSDKKNKKKIKKKKKSRRDGYISDSASCSTCGDEDSSSDEDTNTIKGKNGNRKNRNRQMRSSSPYKDDDDDNIENVTMENNPRRLKSVITIATQPENEEGDDMKRYDEVKEEMVYDYDHDYDYPSCKSNDSNDGETKKELVDNNNISVMNKEKDNLESGVDDLESILRQKALENLSRFRGGIQTKTVVDPVIDNKEKNVVENPVSQPVIQRSRFTWRRDEHEKTDTTYSGPDSSGSQPKLQSTDLSSTERVENIMNTHENVEVNKSTDGVETPSSASGSNEASQFEKKTMSVMRGGEMVQVSYKVYIPNRAPALARRQLKR